MARDKIVSGARVIRIALLEEDAEHLLDAIKCARKQLKRINYEESRVDHRLRQCALKIAAARPDTV